MMGIEVLIFFTVFAAMILFFLSLYFYDEYRGVRRELSARVKEIKGEKQLEENSGFPAAIKTWWMRGIQSLGILLKPKSEEDISHLRKTFLKAGVRGERAPIIFFGMKAFLAMLLAAGVIVAKLFILKTVPHLQSMFFAILFALIGYYLPSLWLHIRISNRKEKIQRGLPDALDLMVVCVEAGTGLDAAINRVGEEMKFTNKVLSEEFTILNLELRAGKQRREALKNLALRTDLEDVSSLVTILIQTERFGTSIGQALRVHSDSMRAKRYQRAEEIAQKMPVKLIFPLVLFIFPALLVVTMGPAVIQILRGLIQITASR